MAEIAKLQCEAPAPTTPQECSWPAPSLAPPALASMMHPKEEMKMPGFMATVPTPSGRRCIRPVLPPAPELHEGPPEVEDGIVVELEEEASLQKGDVVTVHRDFMSSSLIRVKILKGWRGHVVRLDSIGDALVSFEEAKLLWVARRHFPNLTPDAPADTEEVVACSPEVEAVIRKHRSNGGFPVWLHVYDLGQVSRLVLNSWAAQGSGPGGAFHCGLEVIGVEFSFQAVASSEQDDAVSGVTWHTPKSHPRHVYRESVWLGISPLSMADIARVLEQMERLWLARDYHCLWNNCTDFAEQLAVELRAPCTFPKWAHGVAKSPLLAAAGGCCAPVVLPRAQGTRLAQCCSGWSSPEDTSSDL
mmetsp:Transcript_86421/g.201025  ORF Transcript_86421/g.201025 Transcript_86421/m.201025 type:complete len:360 (-) Transcript_86421:134-1213(-)